jgi:hypothetical protein
MVVEEFFFTFMVSVVDGAMISTDGSCLLFSVWTRMTGDLPWEVIFWFTIQAFKLLSLE